jgi:hypothetical protein
MKPYEELKLWSLLFDLNGFIHELIDPQTNNMLLITWGQTRSQKSAQIPHCWPQKTFGLDSLYNQGKTKVEEEASKGE